MPQEEQLEKGGIKVETGTDCRSLWFEEKDRVYPCPCGKTHRGDGAIEGWLRHSCLHERPGCVIAIERCVDADIGKAVYCICGDCGATLMARDVLRR